jgi:uncharacterized YccA/Bax inhibitor family protein
MGRGRETSVALQTHNPAFQTKVAKGHLAGAGMASVDAASAGRAAPIADPTVRPMTINGTVHVTALLLGIVFVAAYFGWRLVSVDPAGDIRPPVWMFIALVGALVFAFVTIFRPQTAHITGPIYAVLEGLVLGALSHIFELQYDGIVLQAIVATMGVSATMLILYRSGRIRVTPRFVKGVIGATFGILGVYVFGWISSLFGADVRFWDEPTPLGILITLGIVVIAALNLVLDFAFIEQAAKEGVPRQWEWYFAFGVVVTLVWLYIELLRLLALLSGRD